MIDGVVLDLLGFYQRELRESREGRDILRRLGITEPEVLDYFSLGYCSGRALAAASEEQYEEFKRLNLADKRRERLLKCLVVPVRDRTGRLVDIVGIRRYRSDTREINWHKVPKGLIGADRLRGAGEVILCDSPLNAIQICQHGHRNVVSLRTARDGSAELKKHIRMLDDAGVRRVYIASRQGIARLAPIIKRAGMDVVPLQIPHKARRVPAELLSVVGTLPLTGEEPCGVKLTNSSGGRLVFQAGETTYTLDAGTMTGLGMRAQIRVARSGTSLIDRLDLVSSSSRRKFARMSAVRLGTTSRDVEDHLCAIAEHLDSLEAGQREEDDKPAKLGPDERSAAEELLRARDLLRRLAGALEGHFGLVGEGANRKLAVLVAVSKLLDRPLGAIVRGPAGCGKSALVEAAAKLLPSSEVLNFSRLTAQSLYFMPREMLQHKLLMVDEYEGLAEAEYALRTMMSSGKLSLAITLREGGRVPVTRSIEVPTSLAVLVSTTREVNIENLSRFIELRMDDSAAQTRSVMEGLAMMSRGQTGAAGEMELMRNALGLLRNCRVRVPYAHRLVYASGNVLARRQFGQLIGLISAHAALCQLQRAGEEGAGGELVVVAEKADYQAVHELLGSVMEHFEEGISPAAMTLLDRLQEEGSKAVTRKEIMERMLWSYGKTHRTLSELVSLDLLIADTQCSGALRTYEVAPYFRIRGGISNIRPPQAI